MLITASATAKMSEQLAESFAKAVEAVDILTKNGIAAKEAWNKIMFQLPVQNNYFFEIAKLRAARICFELITNQYQLNDAEIYVTAQTTLTPQPEIDAHNNTLAATTQAMSAIIGGANCLTVLPFNALDEKATPFSKRIARNIQLILKEESFLDKVVDPTKGAYYMETLTNELVKKLWKILRKRCPISQNYLTILQIKKPFFLIKKLGKLPNLLKLKPTIPKKILLR